MNAPTLKELAKKYASASISSQVHLPQLRTWFAPKNNSCVVYHATPFAWVALGPPLCEPKKRTKTIAAFTKAARRRGKRARFFGCQTIAPKMSNTCIGEEPLWDIAQWQDTLAAKASLREQLRRAKAKGVHCLRFAKNEIAQVSHPYHQDIVALQDDWLSTRPLAPFSFAIKAAPWHGSASKTFIIAIQKEQIVGALILAPIGNSKRVYVEQLYRGQGSPNGVAELLFDEAMSTGAAMGKTELSFGMVPLSGPVHPWMARIRKHSELFYRFEGVHAFKSKLMPTRWAPVYLWHRRFEPAPIAIADTLHAFADGNFTTFALKTLRHWMR